MYNLSVKIASLKKTSTLNNQTKKPNWENIQSTDKKHETKETNIKATEWEKLDKYWDCSTWDASFITKNSSLRWISCTRLKT